MLPEGTDLERCPMDLEDYGVSASSMEDINTELSSSERQAWLLRLVPRQVESIREHFPKGSVIHYQN